MTDNEITKALECCANDGDCKDCCINPNKGNYGYCTSLAIKAALDLINRQRAEISVKKKLLDKAEIEIERLEQRFVEVNKTLKAEAIKEFAERVKHIIGFDDLIPTDCVMLFPYLDNLVKEMTGTYEP